MITNAIEELMENLVEECSEVIKCVTKINRFTHEKNPVKDKERLEHFKEEMMDVFGSISALLCEMEIYEESAEGERLFRLAQDKLKKRISFMQFKPKHTDKLFSNE